MLEILYLEECRQLTDTGLKEILRISRSNLRDLNLSYTPITGVGVEEGVKYLPMLETLILHECRQLNHKGLTEILRMGRQQTTIAC